MENTGYVSISEFIRRLPWLYRKYPVLARFFKNIEKDSSAVMNFDEFMQYLCPPRARQELYRDDLQLCYDIKIEDELSSSGRKFHRTRSTSRIDPWEPKLKCEVTGPCDDIHHQGQRFEWILEDIPKLRRDTPTQLSITSRSFKIAGTGGLLRLWPKGYPSKLQYWNKNQQHDGWLALERFFRQEPESGSASF